MKKTVFPILLVFSTSAFAHTEELQVIEVGHGRHSSTLVDFIPSISKIEGKELINRREVTLGDTIKHEPGVQSTSFGPNAGRPIIRGLDGDRIRILQNGLGTLDASSQSADHALPIDTLTIDKVEIVRGPTALLYGSSAVGGVVNVINSRIHKEFTPGLVNQLDLRGQTVNDGISGAARIDYGQNNWMYHIDGSYLNSSDTRIPKYAQDRKLRKEIPAEERTRDHLENSENLQTSASFGISRIFERGYAGVSYYRFDNEYGTVADPDVDIRMQQNRIEFAGELRQDQGLLRKINFRSAQSFYKHEELESDHIGTTFRNEGNESRLEFHSGRGDLSGVSGLQTQLSTFKALGEEAFLPTSKTRTIALFTLQELSLKNQNAIQLGGRLESAHIEKESSDRFGGSKKNTFEGVSGSLGYLHKFSKTHSSSLSLSYTERAPNFQELYADGEHVATGTYEIGDDSLNKEKVIALEGSFKKDRPDSKLTISGYFQNFHDYIALMPTGTTNSDPDVPDYQYEQKRAYLYGGEIESLEEIVHSFAGGSWWLNTRADIVIGWNETDGSFLPRLPAPRVMLGLEYQRDLFSADIEWERYFEQTRTDREEESTEAFSFLNLGMTYDMPRGDQSFRFYARVRNLLDQEGRLHTSVLRRTAPLPGRNFLAGIQAVF